MKAVWLAAGLIAAGIVVANFHDLLLLIFAAMLFAIPLRGAAVLLARVTRTPVAVGLIGALAGLAVIAILVLETAGARRPT